MKKSLFVETETPARDSLKLGHNQPKTAKNNNRQPRFEIDLFKKQPKKVEVQHVLPKQAQKDNFNLNLENVKYDIKLRSYSKRVEDRTNTTIDNFQTTKLDILISSSNGNVEENSKLTQNLNKTNLEKKLNSNSISDGTKKLMTKVYEIDLVPLTTGNSNTVKNTKKNFISSRELQANASSTNYLVNSNKNLVNLNNNNSINSAANRRSNSIVSSIKREQVL